MVLRGAIVFTIFPAVKLKRYWRNNICWRFLPNRIYHCPNILNWPELRNRYPPIDFYEQAKHIRGSQTKITFSPRPLTSFLAILKNIAEQEEWTNSNPRVQTVNQSRATRTAKKRRCISNTSLRQVLDIFSKYLNSISSPSPFKI
jgi:hypothetical protein